MKELIRYHSRKYFKSNKIILPLLFWILYMILCYSQLNLSYLPDIVMSSGILFFVMTWIGYGYQDVENPISEQLLILKVHNYYFYHLSKVIFLILITSVMSFIGVAFPVLKNALLQYRLFNTSITITDMLYGFILHLIVASIGTMTGALCHPRIIRDKRFSVLIALSVALIGYTKGMIEKDIPIIRFFIWIFPPIYDILESFRKVSVFQMNNMIFPVIYGSIYCIILIFLQLFLLKHNKF